MLHTLVVPIYVNLWIVSLLVPLIAYGLVKQRGRASFHAGEAVALANWPIAMMLLLVVLGRLDFWEVALVAGLWATATFCFAAAVGYRQLTDDSRCRRQGIPVAMRPWSHWAGLALGVTFSAGSLLAFLVP
ncbi:hypothetical protein Pan216_20360 [Planctomycetes bacterium Pan216]|uniref:Uncharacterized protein n=1 Tax=Kolteria novifilia TaxID=2527975 RepID=A0A518B2L1_9BACT|nr:hypothetical protein Pan216_20360 [Planctomycetes bacterium Pan216]